MNGHKTLVRTVDILELLFNKKGIFLKRLILG